MKAISKKQALLLAGLAIAIGWIVFFANSQPQQNFHQSFPAWPTNAEAGMALRTPNYCLESSCSTTPPASVGPSGPNGCSSSDNDSDGQTPCGGDCNDRDPTIFKGAVDYCGNSIDEDCSGADSVCDASAVIQSTKNNFSVGEKVELN